MLLDAIHRVLRTGDTIGFYAVVVDALHDRARTFHERYGFVPFPSQPLRLHLPFRTFEPLRLKRVERGAKRHGLGYPVPSCDTVFGALSPVARPASKVSGCRGRVRRQNDIPGLVIVSRRFHGRLSAHLMLSAARMHIIPACLCRFTVSGTVSLLIPRSRAFDAVLGIVSGSARSDTPGDLDDSNASGIVFFPKPYFLSRSDERLDGPCSSRCRSFQWPPLDRA